MRVLVADDHWIARSALMQIIQTISPDVTCFEASGYDEAIEIVSQETVNLLLIDLMMPGKNPFEGLQAIKKVVPSVPIIVVSVSEDRKDVLRAVDAGVAGFIPKTADKDEIIKSVEMVIGGNMALPRDILQKPASAPTHADMAPNAGISKEITEERLTNRQREVYALLARGMSNGDIALRLGLSTNTVRVHIQSILQRLNLSSRTHAALSAAQHADNAQEAVLQ